MPTHAEARQLATVALQRRFGVLPTQGEIKALAGVAWLETNYGAGWAGSAGENSNNMGAVTAGSSWSGDTFLHTDTKPDENGVSVQYVTRFRKYSTPTEGWSDLATEVFAANGRETVRRVARSEDWAGVSAELYRTGYYKGFGSSSAERIANHEKALRGAIALADGKPVDSAANLPRVTVRVVSPQDVPIGIASITEVDAVGLTVLTGIYGPPSMMAFPNGQRLLNFAPGVLIPGRKNIPYEGFAGTSSGFGWGQAGVVLGIASLAATIFYGSLNVKPGRRSHAR
jgi:hypothetical protein